MFDRPHLRLVGSVDKTLEVVWLHFEEPPSIPEQIL